MHDRHYTQRSASQALVRQSHLLAQLEVGPVELAMQECQLPRDGALLLPEASDGRQSRLQFLLLGSDSTGMTCAGSVTLCQSNVHGSRRFMGFKPYRIWHSHTSCSVSRWRMSSWTAHLSAASYYSENVCIADKEQESAQTCTRWRSEASVSAARVSASPRSCSCCRRSSRSCCSACRSTYNKDFSPPRTRLSHQALRLLSGASRSL